MDLTLFITSDGMEKLQRRIAFLMNDERPKVIKALAIASLCFCPPESLIPLSPT